MIRKALALVLASLLLSGSPAFAQSGGSPPIPIPVPVNKGGTGATNAAAARTNLGITGTGDVVGPASTTDNALPLFDGTTGKLLKGIAAPAVGQVLKSNGVGVAPSWSASPSLTSLTLAAGTITTSQPGLNLTQTLNAGAVAFSGALIDITNTASATLSMPLQVRVGGVDRFRVYRDAITGVAFGAGTNAPGQQNMFVLQNADTTEFDVNGGTANFYVNGGYAMELVSGAIRTAGGIIGFNSAYGAAPDANFSRISAGVIGVGTGAQGSVAGGLQAATLALGGNGALSAPVLSGTGTWITGGSATTTKPYALIEPAGTTSTAWSTSGTGLGVNAATGFAGNLIDLQVSAASKFKVDASGNMTTANNMTGGNITSGYYLQANTAGIMYFNNSTSLLAPSNGLLQLTNYANTDFTGLVFGTNNTSGIRLAKSTTTLQVKLGDSSAFTAIQGKLTTDTAYTAGDPTTTGYLVVYDSTGTAYRVPALLN